MKTLDELIEKSIEKKDVKVAVAVAEDAHVLEAVVEARQKNIADFILVGNKSKISRILADLGADQESFEIIDEQDKIMACEKCVELIVDKKASLLMKGLVDTSIVIRAVLDREKGLRTGSRLSHLAAFETLAYHKVLFITDSAINIDPDLETKKSIVKNAVGAVRKLDIKEPNVALLCAKEKVDEKMPVTLDYKQLVKMNEVGEIKDCKIAGPLSLDLAVSKKAAEIKGVESPVCGETDIMVCPDIEAGNILYKSLAFLGNARSGGVVLGAKAPIIVTSRADSSDNKLIGIALGVLFC